MNNTKIAIRLAVIAVIALTLITMTELRARTTYSLDKIGLLATVRHNLISQYVEEPDQELMIENAVRGMISALEDPYTSFVSKSELESFESQITGNFSGIGAEVDIKDRRLRIVSPLEDSPAWKSGILAGDVVLAIEGEDTIDIKLNEAVSKLKGPAGTDVTITVRHTTGEEKDITITRGKINIQTVRGFQRQEDHSYDFMLDDVNKIGYIRVTQFNGKTANDLKNAIEELKSADLQGLILDLRFDPGGLLTAAVTISDYFLPEGQRIVSTKGRVVPEVVHTATDKGTLISADIPLVVIANESSASASEIVTGALSDNERALFVGTRTFGKGSVQEIRELTTGAETAGLLKFTNAYYYLPNGRNIHKREGKDTWGVDPSPGAYVRMTPKQIEEMIKVRRESDILRQTDGQNIEQAISPEWINDTLKDPQLASSLQAVLGKLDTGEWPTVGSTNPEILVLETKRDNLNRRRSLLADTLTEIDKKIEEVEAEINGEPIIEPAEQTASIDPTNPETEAAIPTPTAELAQ
ncbi:putative CtpA-like serine protease [Poriferisphaera corsica]|uniref:Putative CtpA-like serine protease n=1 Tax=Poriferisphaera corsica TaxID=2528020 RepID=A0A517YVW1_9BACT|nr:S41 family peptidase [Poriferisphaera corsica]QDU34366.1 putative CtpA-like serine protease [Poriferisphaera corsica]